MEAFEFKTFPKCTLSPEEEKDFEYVLKEPYNHLNEPCLYVRKLLKEKQDLLKENIPEVCKELLSCFNEFDYLEPVLAYETAFDLLFLNQKPDIWRIILLTPAYISRGKIASIIDFVMKKYRFVEKRDSHTNPVFQFFEHSETLEKINIILAQDYATAIDIRFRRNKFKDLDEYYETIDPETMNDPDISDIYSLSSLELFANEPETISFLEGILNNQNIFHSYRILYFYKSGLIINTNFIEDNYMNSSFYLSENALNTAKTSLTNYFDRNGKYIMNRFDEDNGLINHTFEDAIKFTQKILTYIHDIKMLNSQLLLSTAKNVREFILIDKYDHQPYNKRRINFDMEELIKFFENPNHIKIHLGVSSPNLFDRASALIGLSEIDEASKLENRTLINFMVMSLKKKYDILRNIIRYAQNLGKTMHEYTNKLNLEYGKNVVSVLLEHIFPKFNEIKNRCLIVSKNISGTAMNEDRLSNVYTQLTNSGKYENGHLYETRVNLYDSIINMCVNYLYVKSYVEDEKLLFELSPESFESALLFSIYLSIILSTNEYLFNARSNHKIISKDIQNSIEQAKKLFNNEAYAIGIDVNVVETVNVMFDAFKEDLVYFHMNNLTYHNIDLFNQLKIANLKLFNNQGYDALIVATRYLFHNNQLVRTNIPVNNIYYENIAKAKLLKNIEDYETFELNIKSSVLAYYLNKYYSILSNILHNNDSTLDALLHYLRYIVKYENVENTEEALSKALDDLLENKNTINNEQ